MEATQALRQKLEDLQAKIEEEIASVHQARVRRKIHAYDGTVSFCNPVSAYVDASEAAKSALRNLQGTEGTLVDGLYSYDEEDKKFVLQFTDGGVAYGDTEKSEDTITLELDLPDDDGSFDVVFHETPVSKWGINFAGAIEVTHRETLDTRIIFLPGTRTYDPAGKSGDPHCSERMGNSCAQTQTAITTAQLAALTRGADKAKLDALQDKFAPLVTRYHGRELLFAWMKHQLEAAVLRNEDPLSYPEFLKGEQKNGNLNLDEETRAHTKAYLESFDAMKPMPPNQYFKKQAQKEDMKDVLDDSSLAVFEKLATTV